MTKKGEYSEIAGLFRRCTAVHRTKHLVLGRGSISTQSGEAAVVPDVKGAKSGGFHKRLRMPVTF